jgi:hypothetical protein
VTAEKERRYNMDVINVIIKPLNKTLFNKARNERESHYNNDVKEIYIAFKFEFKMKRA